MQTDSATPAVQSPLDGLTIHAFVKEIVDAIDNVSSATLSSNGRDVLWTQTFQSAAASAANLPPTGVVETSESSKQSLGNGYTAYHFPLSCENIQGCVFTLLIYSVDPPNLSSVSFSVNNMLNCLARQIDVDLMLSTTRLVVSPAKPASAFTLELEALETSDDTESTLRSLASACLTDYDLESVVIAVPASKYLIICSSPRFDEKSVKRLLAQIHRPMREKRKLISATISLREGTDGHLVAAPIISNQKSMHGVVFVVSQSSSVSLSNVVRTIANRVGSTVNLDASQSTILTRAELVSRIDGVVGQQPTLPHSLIYFDADRMHTINDAFGYSGGDRALATFRRILFDSVGANDFVAHLGSDRFAVFMPGASGDTSTSKADQVLRLLAQEVIDDENKSINLSASAGIVDTEAASKGAEDMLILAEVASRGAQERGGNQCALFQDIDSSIIQRRSDVDKVGFLQMALIENRFTLHAQRIQAITVESGQKFELLARLDSDNVENRSPAEFLSAAERYQLMAALDRWVINSALSSIAGAENALEVSLSTFAINVSAQSLQDNTFIEFVESRIAETGVAPESLCFELTETSLVRHLDRAQRFVHRLQRLGCQVALDDFGTGYSSFAYLKTLPVNYLKVDGVFVRDLLENELSRAIVNAVVSIASVIGAQTVAEHVENPMVQAWLKEAGVHFVQGFSVHRPESFEKVLAEIDEVQCNFGLDEKLDLRSDVLSSTA